MENKPSTVLTDNHDVKDKPQSLQPPSDCEGENKKKRKAPTKKKKAPEKKKKVDVDSVLRLRQEGKTAKEIGQILGFTESAIRGAIFRWNKKQKQKKASQGGVDDDDDDEEEGNVKDSDEDDVEKEVNNNNSTTAGSVESSSSSAAAAALAKPASELRPKPRIGVNVMRYHMPSERKTKQKHRSEDLDDLRRSYHNDDWL